ncbi:MAG TPA: hypothetical protein PKW35_06035 [Nannocystaceae bacterium]|nr:hypothetical protein [Nannocystaceae bacterium]
MSSTLSILRLAPALALVLAVGCGGGDKPGAPAKNPSEEGKVAAAPTPGPAAGGAADAGDKVKVVAGKDPLDDRYVLTVEPPADLAVGAQGVVKVTVVPKAPWHMNLDYPTSLAVTAPKDVTLPKAEQRKDDAVKIDDNGAEFGVAFTPASAGDKSFTGTFKFAVCQEDACAPVTEDIEFRVAVK